MHNHILPGIDDGAKNVEDSIAILQGFSELGIKRFIATPHIITNLYPNDQSTIYNSNRVLENALIEAGLTGISIEAAAEHMIDDNFSKMLSDQDVLPIRKKYLLVEMSYLQRPLNFKEAIIQIANMGYYPILAHPERYMFLHKRKNKYEVYKKRGILFQMNMLSLSEYYGREVQKISHFLLDRELIDFLGSDIHNMGQLEYLKNISLPNKTIRKLLPIIENTILTFY